MTLEQYFKLIIKPTQPQKKETNMNFLKLSMFFTEQLENFKKLWYKPNTEVIEDYWSFEMYTEEWVDENGKVHPVKHSVIIEPHESTWPEVLDKILDELGKHYGYNIKEQVYYSVNFPLNGTNPFTGEPVPGDTRLLNDDVLQQLLLAFPEVYHWKDNGDMFK